MCTLILSSLRNVFHIIVPGAFRENAVQIEITAAHSLRSKQRKSSNMSFAKFTELDEQLTFPLRAPPPLWHDLQ